MAQASVSRQSIQDALAALDAQPVDPGQDANFAQAVAVAKSALRQALAQDPSPESQQVAVLIADLSGYTAIAERMDAEQVRDAMNAMWLELDGAVSAWGGRIEQHAGDSLVALFGLPHTRPSDAWRAVQAALALQLELTAFNSRVRRQAGDSDHAAWLERWPGPQMRIGVHEGPIAMTKSTHTAPQAISGETLRIAYALEEAAPPGAILVSAPIRQRVQGAFQLEAPRPRRSRTSSFLVGAPRPQQPPWQPGVVADSVPRLVGRSEALDDLEDAFQRAIDATSLEIVSLIGETGSGKKRLLQEFLPGLQILSSDVTVLHSKMHPQLIGQPYSLLRDLIRRYLDIYPAHSANAVRVRIAASPLVDPGATDQQSIVGALEHLLLPDDGPAPALADMTELARTFMIAAAGSGALVLGVADLHYADAYSLALLDDLILAGVPVPVLLVGLAQPALLARPSASAVAWLTDLTDPFLPATRITLSPLSAVESRLLAADLLRPASPVPQRLIDLVVADANGNPWAIEETVKHLIDIGLIVPGPRRQFDMARIEAEILPRTLAALVEARLRQLPPLEQQVLGAAAVVGTVFWDTAIFALLRDEVTAQDILAALARLVADGWVYRDNQVSLGEAQGYFFARALVQSVALAGLLPETRETQVQRLFQWQNNLPAEWGRSEWFVAKSEGVEAQSTHSDTAINAETGTQGP